MGGYLFAFFTGDKKDQEQIYFSLSRDGLHWKDLNQGRPVLFSRIGTKGVRDPFLVRNPLNQKIYLLATDLRIEAGMGWEAAREEGSRDILVWESKDLTAWSRERACRIGPEGAGCVWAPEAVYDEKKRSILVFFASRLRGKFSIYAVYTQDFRSFSSPFLYIEREKDIIDTTILKSKGRYFRISKEEVGSNLTLEVSECLDGSFRSVPAPILEGICGVEGPEGYLLPDGKTWCILADRFAAGKGYFPLVTENLESGRFFILPPETYDMGKMKKRHGGILPITDKEYERVWKYYGGEKEM